MKARDEVKLGVLRMAISAVKNFKIEKYGTTDTQPTDEEVVNILTKQIKQRKDSISSFESAGRQDLVDKEKSEVVHLDPYLPEQMSEEDVRNIVQETLKELNATSPQESGRAIGAIMAKLKGKTEGSLVTKLVKETLQ
ncbi:MAG: GatB/YqeY domain-containing protein [bacterium]|nr:GatB/YqeY domain-containing protein [bacterium]